MPLFDYIVLTPDGSKSAGKIDAPNQDMAMDRLREEGYVPLDVTAVKQQINVEDILAKYRPIPRELLVIFSRQLATMIDAQMPALQAVQVLEEQTENPKFRDVLKRVITDLEGGRQLNESLAEHPEIFDLQYTAMVRAGEASGNLDGALKDIALQLEKDLHIRRQVKSATVYPKVVMAIAFLIVSVLLLFIVPVFADMFVKAIEATPAVDGQPKPSASLPWPTRVVVGISHFLYPDRKTWIGAEGAFNASWSVVLLPIKLLGLAGVKIVAYQSIIEAHRTMFWLLEVLVRMVSIVGLVIGARRVTKIVFSRPGPRAWWDRRKLKLPMKIGPLIQKIAVARFSRSFASLLSAAVPAGEAMDIVADTSGNYVLAQAIREGKDRLLAGATIHAPLAKAGVFPTMVTRMIQVGEETGQLETMLTKIAEFYEAEVDATMKAFSSLVEPLMIFAVGLMIGSIVIATYLPMFQIYNLVG